MATKNENKAPSVEDLQAQLAEMQAEKAAMEKRVAEAEQAGGIALAEKEQAEAARAEAEAAALASREAAEAARAEAENAKAEAEAAKAEAENAKAEAEAGKTDTPESGAGGSAPGTGNAEMYEVYCKIPAGMTFPLPDGRRVKLAGVPLSRLTDSAGLPLPGSGYGKTMVAADDWRYIKKTWKSHPVFRPGNPVIFARAVGKHGDDQAVEQAGVTTGFEQIKVDGKDKAKGLKTEPAQK